MTDYVFQPNASADFVNWSNPAVWKSGVVPNAPDADVDFPIVTYAGSGQTYESFVSIQSNESFAVHSVDLRDYLLVYGSLSVSGTLNNDSAGGEIDMYGGTITAGTFLNSGFDIQGNGHIVAGTLTNNSMIVNDGNLVIDATTLINQGTLAAAGGVLTINVGSGGMTGLANGVITSGELKAYSNGTLLLHASGAITTDAAMITLSGGVITARDPVTGLDVALTDSLHNVATGGTLTVAAASSYTFGTLNVAGTLALADSSKFASSQLVITTGGQLQGEGTLLSPLENDGVIRAGQAALGLGGNVGTLVLDGAITGTGSMEILAGHVRMGRFDEGYGATLEIAGATAQNVTFDDGTGTLRLDQPSNFTGSIATSAGTDAIILSGVSLASITSESYVGNAAGGTLILQEASGQLSLHFTGSHTIGNFSLSAGPQVLSSDPPSLAIAVSGYGISADQDFNGDGHSDILWQNANGAVSTWHATGTGINDGIVQDTYDASVATSWTAIDSFDFNGDGKADILWQNQNGTMAVWDGTSNGFAQSSYVDQGLKSLGSIVGTGDFNGDGREDVLFRQSDGSISIAGSTGTTLQIGAALGYNHASVGTSWTVEGAADFTGDGKADILWRNTDGSLSTWDANGSVATGTSFQEDSWFHGPIDLSWHVVGLGDFNGDGKADILWRNDNGAVSVWTSTGNGAFAENQVNAVAATSWSVAEVGDFNGDGLEDILWRNTNGQISIWHSTGSGWLQNTYSDSSVGNDWTIAAHHFSL